MMVERLVARLIRSGLRSAFRRVVWMGPAADLDPGRPVVLLANHQNFHDGHLLWLVNQFLNRETVIWMEDWDRFPLFTPQGAFPFPKDDPRRRAQTIRTTARKFREVATTSLGYFPEGVLHRPEDELLPFDTDHLRRLDHLLGHPQWLPLAIHATWEVAARPSALLLAGTPADGIDGNESTRLSNLVARLRGMDPGGGQVLLEGGPGPNEGMSLSLTAPFFRRYLR